MKRQDPGNRYRMMISNILTKLFSRPENKDVKMVAAFKKRGLKSANPNPFC